MLPKKPRYKFIKFIFACSSMSLGYELVIFPHVHEVHDVHLVHHVHRDEDRQGQGELFTQVEVSI